MHGGLADLPTDMARYMAALLHGGGKHGPVLKPDTLAGMFQPHFQLDQLTAPAWFRPDHRADGPDRCHPVAPDRWPAQMAA
jgi:CubicO group peptidase (beta-lactamase class C family)